MRATAVIVSLCGMFLFSAPALSQVQEIAAECTTDKTGVNGVRHGCESELSRIMAPTDHVFAERSLQGGEISGNGSEHECRLRWEDYVEVIPESGIMQPRTITLQAHARSPKGHASGRGWAKCKYSAQVSKYRN